MESSTKPKFRKSGVATPPKGELCRLVGCPSAIPLDDPIADAERRSKCARCTGPVRWTDSDGRRNGLHRACSSCPMNGLGLDVCWCGCDGPSQEFTTDGQSMVTTGGVGDSTGFVENQMEDGALDASDSGGVDRMIDEIDGVFDRGASESDGRMAIDVAARILAADIDAFDRFRAAFLEGRVREAASTIGAPAVAFRNDASVGTVVARAVCGMSGEQWRIVKRMVAGESQASVGEKFGDGRRLGISRQAVNKRVMDIIEANPWVRRIVELKNGVRYDPAHARAREVSRHCIK